MPAAMKTISAPSTASRISSTDSSAAFWPRVGCPPDPSPRVALSPTRIRVGALDRTRACASVFTAMNSMPCTSSSIMRSTALLPPPPMPTTLRSARDSSLDRRSERFPVFNLVIRLPPRLSSSAIARHPSSARRYRMCSFPAWFYHRGIAIMQQPNHDGAAFNVRKASLQNASKSLCGLEFLLVGLARYGSRISSRRGKRFARGQSRY